MNATDESGREQALASLESVEGPFEWAKRLLPAENRLWSREELRRRWGSIEADPRVATWRPPAEVVEAAGPSVAGFPPFFILGDGPARALVIASPHADEPVGVSTALALMEGLLRPENAPMLSALRLAVVPMANPAGYAENEPWFAATNALEAREPGREFKMRMMSAPKIRAMEKPRPGNLELADAIEECVASYLEHRRRSLPEFDVEFGYAAPGSDPADPTADFLPPCRLIASFIDALCERWGGLDLICPLHSMGSAGGAWALLRAADPAQPGPEAEVFMAPFRYAAAVTGLGLHDQDRKGEKGFWRLGPGFHSTPTAEAMRAYFAERAASVSIRYNSMQYAGERARRAAVPEIPLFLCRKLKDESPSGQSAASVATRSAQGAEAAARTLSQGVSGEGSEQARAHRDYLLSQATAKRRDAERSDAQTAVAPTRDVARLRIEAACHQATAASLASLESPEERDRALFRELARGLLREEGLRPVSLKHQTLLQLSLFWAGCCRL
jgi:hypothetical protein